jgi:hypothetical protein
MKLFPRVARGPGDPEPQLFVIDGNMLRALTEEEDRFLESRYQAFHDKLAHRDHPTEEA